MSSPVDHRAVPKRAPEGAPSDTEELVIGVVEDSDEDFAIFSRMFRRQAARARVHRWERAEAALDSLMKGDGQPARRPDVLVVDLSLPGIDGCELVRRLRSHPETARVPMFMLSGSDRKGDVDRCLEAGANGYFKKSIHPSDLQIALEQILAAGGRA